MSDAVAIIRERQATAIVRAGDADSAREAMRAAVAGGFGVCEFTLTTPGAYALISEFASSGDVLVGAGTVLTPAQARDAVQAGAGFLVSPVVDERVIAAAQALGVPMMPGCHTPTELLRAHEAGAALQKLFPGPAGGPAWVRSVLGPLPDLRIVPTNGVDAANVRDWLDAGAVACGFVTSLFDPALMRERDWSGVAARAREILGAIAGA